MSDEPKDVLDNYDEEFEFLDTVDFAGEKYFVMIPATEDEDEVDCEVYVMKLVTEDGEEMLEAVDDDAEFSAVYEIFKQNNADEFEFLD